MTKTNEALKLLEKEVADASPEIIEEVVDFMKYLKYQVKEEKANYLISETSLKKDWLSDKEKKAWQSL